MGWFRNELRLVQGPMVRWWLSVGIWWLGAAAVLFAIEVVLKLWLVGPWERDMVEGFGGWEVFGVPGPAGLTASIWGTVFSLIRTGVYVFCILAWALAADHAIRVRASLVQDVPVPANSRHRQGGYFLALAQGALPLALLVLHSLFLDLLHMLKSADGYSNLWDIWDVTGFFMQPGVHNTALSVAQAMTVLLVPLVVLRSRRWLAWTWLGAQLLLPLGIAALADAYQLTGGYTQYYQRPPSYLQNLTEGAGFGWEMGGVLVFSLLWLFARGYLRVAMLPLCAALASAALVVFGHFIAAPLLFYQRPANPPWGFPEPDADAAVLADIIRGPQVFLQDSLCQWDTDYDWRTKTTTYSVAFSQPLHGHIVLPPGFRWTVPLINAAWIVLLAWLIFALILPEPMREPLLL